MTKQKQNKPAYEGEKKNTTKLTTNRESVKFSWWFGFISSNQEKKAMFGVQLHMPGTSLAYNFHGSGEYKRNFCEKPLKLL